MESAIYFGRGDVRVEMHAIPDPKPGEILVRVAFCGVCGTELTEYKSGPLLAHVAPEPHRVTGHSGPVILGHEFAGYVVARGADVSLPIGTLVACSGCVGCGVCARCTNGKSNLCNDYTTVGLQRHGGLAELCAVPADTCVDVGPFGVTPYVAALAQPMAVAVHALAVGDVARDQEVAIVGIGGIGAFLLYAVSAAHGVATAIDKTGDQLALAERLGASECIRGDEESVTDGRVGSFSRVFEASGTKAGLDVALRLLAPGGRLVVVGLQAASASVSPRRIMLDELTNVGTKALVPGVDLPEALRVLASRKEGWADVAPMAFPLTDLLPEVLAPDAPRTRTKTLFAPGLSKAAEIGAADERVQSSLGG